MLCIVSVYRPDLIDDLQQMMATTGVPVDIVLDRRHGERRSPERLRAEPATARDRRQRSIDEELRTQGFAIVR